MNSNWSTPQIILMIYAACVSTITLIWNIFNAVLEKSSRIKITAEFRDSMTTSLTGELIKGPITLFVHIVNKSNRNKYISDINIRLPYKTSTGNMFSLVTLDIKYPIEILPQQEYVYKFRFISSPDMFLDNYSEGKAKIIAFDTIRKKYKSNSFDVNKIKQAFNHNCSLSPEVRTLFKV